MPERKSPLLHVVRALEELMLAGSETLAILRERRAEQAGDWLESRLAEMLNQWRPALEQDAEYAVSSLRTALRKELGRWELRAATDPAARRVRELIAALLEVLGDETPGPERAPQRHAPRRAQRS